MSKKKSSKSAKKTTFEYPDYYDYPPFWTLQTNGQTRETQLKLWSNFICAFTKYYKRTEIDLISTLETPLFNNAKLGRKVSQQMAEEIIDSMVKAENAKWLESTKTRVRIIWRTPAQIGQLVHEYLHDIGSLNTVMTYEELVNGEDTTDQGFYGLSMDEFHDAMVYMERQGKCKIMAGKTLSENGVKFF